MPVAEWKGPFEGYVANFIGAQFWRVKATMTADEVMQEAYIVFHRCGQRYPEVNAKHFMALFKTAWHRRFTDLAWKDSAERQAVESFGDSDESLVGETDNDGMLATMLRQAPREIQMVLSLFLNAPAELVEIATQSWAKNGSSHSSTKINALLGLPADQDTMSMVRDYFTESC